MLTFDPVGVRFLYFPFFLAIQPKAIQPLHPLSTCHISNLNPPDFINTLPSQSSLILPLSHYNHLHPCPLSSLLPTRTLSHCILPLSNPFQPIRTIKHTRPGHQPSPCTDHPNATSPPSNPARPPAALPRESPPRTLHASHTPAPVLSTHPIPTQHTIPPSAPTLTPLPLSIIPCLQSPPTSAAAEPDADRRAPKVPATLARSSIPCGLPAKNNRAALSASCLPHCIMNHAIPTRPCTPASCSPPVRLAKPPSNDTYATRLESRTA